MRALVASTDRVLLVEERHADRTPYWTLPGGGVRPGETDPDALRRELREELGCESVVDDRLTRFWYLHTSLANTVSLYDVYECAVLSRPQAVRSEGVLAARWVRPTDPPARTLPHVRSVLRQDGVLEDGTRCDRGRHR